MYAAIGIFAAVENIFPPVPADVACALGAFLAGRGVMNAWLVFLLTWTANVASGAGVYAVARRHGAAITGGALGRRILTPQVMAHVAERYRRHGAYGIFLVRLLPVWRAVVMPFAGIASVSPARALVPMALASAAYYGALVFVVSRLATDFDAVVALLGRVNAVLAIAAAALIVIIVVWVVRRRR